MPENNVLINPLAAVNREAYDAEYHSAVNFGVAGLMDRSQSLRGDLDAAVREAGDDFDVAKIVTLKGDTPTATLGNVVDHHSRLSAVTDILNQKRAIQAQVHRRAEADSRPDDDPIYDHMREVSPTPTTLVDHLRAALVERGYANIAEAARSRAALSMDVGARILAATLKTTDGFPPESVRSGRVTTQGRAPLTLLDIVPTGTITQASHVYMRETTPSTGTTSGATHTVDSSRAASAAAARAEEGGLAESTFAWEEMTDAVRSIGHYLPITEEQLMDVSGIESLIERRMLYGVRQQANIQIAKGTGANNQLKGFTAYKYDNSGSGNADKAASIASTFSRTTVDLSDSDTDAKKGKTMLTSLRKLRTLLETEGAVVPSHVTLHPGSWELISLLETSSAGFYFGDPRLLSGQSIWGLPVVMDQYGLTQFSTAGNVLAVMGDFSSFSEFLLRHDFRVEFGMNADDFRDLRRSVRAYVRAVLSIYRLKAFATMEVVS